MIDGVYVTPLKKFTDERGMVMHILSDMQLSTVREVYASLIKSTAIKAWKRHHKMVQHYAVPIGKIKLVLFDNRLNSSTHNRVQEIVTGIDYYGLIQIPPMVWYGFESLSDGDSLIVNGASLPHDPNEVDCLDKNTREIPYVWGDNLN
ncbi:MAG: dTDP-4-dehydrorhamnose 3,5-epimerase [Pseudomonadota bacterium]